MGAGVVARAAIATEADGSGRTRVTRIRSDGPLALRVTAEAVYLVAAAAGPLGGDTFILDVEVGDNSALTVRSAGAMLVLPGRDGAASELVVRARIGAAGRLVFAPEPTVAVAGCRHRARTEITAAAGARLVWREQLVLGRYGESPGQVSSRRDVEMAGEPLLRDELRAGEPLVDRSCAMFGGAKAVGSTLLAGPQYLAAAQAGPVPEAMSASEGGPMSEGGLAVLRLVGPGILVTALADDALTLSRRLRRGEALSVSPA